MERWEKVLVKPEFFNDVHGRISCVVCHGGNPKETDFKLAHEGVVRDFTHPDASRACGACHGEIVELTKTSLHYTLYPKRRMVQIRGSKEPEIAARLMEGYERHCGVCHASCASCHVSRPPGAGGGFVAGHLFREPDSLNQCMACHGRKTNELLAALGTTLPDVHFAERGMTCTDCHGAELHGDGKVYETRFDVPELVSCLDCHPEVKADNIPAHQIHLGRLSCQVCHAQPYMNCYTCHVGVDELGFPTKVVERAWETFEIGLNPMVSERRPYRFVTVRHIPASPDLFAYLVEDGFPWEEFSTVPTWKMATPHNIRRITPQNRTCASCHLDRELFLTAEDMPIPDVRWLEMNREMIVPEAEIANIARMLQPPPPPPPPPPLRVPVFLIALVVALLIVAVVGIRWGVKRWKK
jgi:thiosulfate/3-mercaptopyruvate sulfurtransferase